MPFFQILKKYIQVTEKSSERGAVQFTIEKEVGVGEQRLIVISRPLSQRLKVTLPPPSS